jgi:hypothetical protein
VKRQAKVGGGMVTFAPQSSDQYYFGSAEAKGFSHGYFAVCCILVGGMGLARHKRIVQQEFRAGGIKIANPELRHKSQGAGMFHAAVRSNDTGPGDLPAQTWGDHKVAAKEDGKSGHARHVAKTA